LRSPAEAGFALHERDTAGAAPIALLRHRPHLRINAAFVDVCVGTCLRDLLRTSPISIEWREAARNSAEHESREATSNARTRSKSDIRSVRHGPNSRLTNHSEERRVAVAPVQ